MDSRHIPKHIVLFPDGNRRWARERGMDVTEGYKEGYLRLIEFCGWCVRRGVNALTVFGFSTENWNRPEREVAFLVKFLEDGIREGFLENKDNPDLRKTRVRIIGDRERLPQSLRDVIAEVEGKTKDYQTLFLNLAISYGGRWDIVQAAQQLVRAGTPADKISEEALAQHLSTAGLPEPDLVIRAGGEQRLSNFVLWQAAYAELYFSPKLWPDFTEQDLDDALEEYANRQRRFGR